MRWRDSRSTLPARRRRRRSRRRDIERGGSYNPIEVSSDAASSGVRFRLVGAVFAVLVTVLSVIAGITAPHSFGAILGIITGLCSFGAAVGLLMSARHEEEVHELAAAFDEHALLEDERADQSIETDGLLDARQPEALPAPAQTDGRI